MSEDLLELSRRVLAGEIPLPQTGLVLDTVPSELSEVAPKIAVVPAFCNLMPVKTAAGLLLVDTGNALTAEASHAVIRKWASDPLHTAIYTHGHIDHVMGMAPWDEEARDRGRPRPRVLAHEAVPERFERYVRTAEYNGLINRRQFGFQNFRWPTQYRYPDETYRGALTVRVGDLRVELRHARGETDDHTWVYLPERRALYPGDLFIWCVPNAGNPQKVQRYALDWAQALRAMAALEPEIMLPSHGLPIAGAEAIRAALCDTAELLESLHDQTLAMMNEGARLNDVLHAVRPPARLLERPYLKPIYDEPEFIVRNIWRYYGGWYDGNPAHLHPAPDAELAAELALLAGGAGRLAARALELAEAGKLRLAGHLAEFAGRAAPEDAEARRARAHVNRLRCKAASSLMAKGIYRWAERESSEPSRSSAK